MQQKVVSYAGVTANTNNGEVEGVCQAVAIFGDTNSATNYLTGWKMDGTSSAKDTKAGFMQKLAKALDAARKQARKISSRSHRAFEKTDGAENTNQRDLGSLQGVPSD